MNSPDVIEEAAPVVQCHRSTRRRTRNTLHERRHADRDSRDDDSDSGGKFVLPKDLLTEEDTTQLCEPVQTTVMEEGEAAGTLQGEQDNLLLEADQTSNKTSNKT